MPQALIASPFASLRARMAATSVFAPAALSILKVNWLITLT
jgi:hypothetical protein